MSFQIKNDVFSFFFLNPKKSTTALPAMYNQPEMKFPSSDEYIPYEKEYQSVSWNGPKKFIFPINSQFNPNGVELFLTVISSFAIK